MRVSIFGTGYVGLVTGTCLADVGHQVVCVDIDQAKVDGLTRGVIPIYEPGLEPMVKANHAASRLAFTTDAASAITHGQVIFIAVGTPPDEDGSADLQYVLAVARTIGQHLQSPVVVVGHQPTLGRVIARLLHLNEEDCPMKKGALWWLRQRERNGALQTVIVTVQTPELL